MLQVDQLQLLKVWNRLRRLEILVQGELIKEQKADSILNALFSQAMSDGSTAQGYFICEGVLISKWTPHAKAVKDYKFYLNGLI